MTSKVCQKCLINKLISCFKEKLNTCNDCRNEYMRLYNLRYRQENRDKLNAKRRESRTLMARHGLKQNTNNKYKCKKRGCDETPGIFWDIIGYCKSHAWDKKTN